MNTFKLISGVIITALITISNAQAGNMTTDELFDYLQAGDENSIHSVETVEFSKLEFNSPSSEAVKIYNRSIDDVFNTINSD